MKAILTVMASLLSVCSVYAGDPPVFTDRDLRRYSYSTDAPLIQSRQALLANMNYLCSESETDLNRYDDEALTSFGRQCNNIEEAINNSDEISSQEKPQYRRKILICGKTFVSFLRTRLQKQHEYSKQQADKHFETARKGKAILKDIDEYVKPYRNR